MSTANGKYKYSKIIFDKSLRIWVQEAHRYNCLQNKWKYFPLKEGAFGFDNIALSLMKVLIKIKKDNSMLKKKNTMAKYIHLGWCENYIYWRDNEPYNQNDFYIKPAKKLGDKRRNECANTKYKDLPEDEKNKDMVFVNFIKKKLDYILKDLDQLHNSEENMVN